MARIGYTVELEPKTSSRAMGSELHISPKKSRELGHAIKGMRTEVAQRYLEEVIGLKRAVPFKRHHVGTGHRKGPMATGRYPIKAAEAFMKILENAKSNAEYKGLDSSKMYLSHIATKQGRVIHGMMARARGRGSPKNTDTVNIEIILSEVR
ncbi:50S ribosomal protein L22 [Methanolobus sp.]|jgi:large subunit ribosomal protein L22|uniref:50S ribosomal protein L22 n=1 Tax=Methanolobus sp. TaxID=1874737 RepID=UPI0025F1C72D|nr:50S ribosomal protein L22 [Methanolobus sp.]